MYLLHPVVVVRSTTVITKIKDSRRQVGESSKKIASLQHSWEVREPFPHSHSNGRYHTVGSLVLRDDFEVVTAGNSGFGDRGILRPAANPVWP